MYQLSAFNDDYLSDLQYMDNSHHTNNKFACPDFVHNNLYLVRFRRGLSDFFAQIASHNNLEIVLWTAAVRTVYTDLMKTVHAMLSEQIKTNKPLWDAILFRDNCTCRQNGSYFKDLSLLNRSMSKMMMVDNIWYNFENFEYNGLPITEYWGHCNDTELPKLSNILRDILSANEAKTADVRQIFHELALKHNFSTFKLENMLQRISYIPELDEEEVYEMEMDFASSQSVCNELYESSEETQCFFSQFGMVFASHFSFLYLSLFSFYVLCIR